LRGPLRDQVEMHGASRDELLEPEHLAYSRPFAVSFTISTATDYSGIVNVKRRVCFMKVSGLSNTIRRMAASLWPRPRIV
jgi:hypothetical protein